MRNKLYILALLVFGVSTISFEASSATLNVSCVGAPAGFSIALVADAGRYAEKKARLECKTQCEKISETRVKSVRPVIIGQTFSFSSSNIGGFGARGTVATELCKDGGLYKGEKAVEVKYLVNGILKTATVAYPIAMPDIQFTQNIWEFKIESIK